MRECDGHQGYAPGSFLAVEQSTQSCTVDPTYSEIPPTLNNNNTSYDSKEPCKYCIYILSSTLGKI